MKQKLINLTAIFIIQLVLTIPFYTTSVYATINSVTVKGTDGIEGYAKSDDFLNFNVQASISGDTVKNEQVLLGSGIKFDKCTPSINNGSECTLRFPSNGTASFEAKPMPFTINLYRSDRTIDDSKAGSVTVDNKAPQVKLSAQSTFSSKQNITIDYDVTDFACDDSSCDNKCVGIKNIEFHTLDGAFQQTVTPTTNDCNIKSSIGIDSQTLNQGKNSVFAKATDKFNQVSAETSVTFDVDTKGPQIIANSFAIMAKGISISTYSPNSVPVDVIVNVSASDLDLNSVIADLSGLNPSQNLKNTKASCTAIEEGSSICTWSIDLNPNQGGLKSIVINASDTSGNQESAAISKLLSIDDKGPVVQSLSTTTSTTSQVLAKSSGNTVIAVFDEETGLSAEQVFLNVDGSKIISTSCSKESNWICRWENVNFGSSTSTISIETDTTDVLGNAVSGGNPITVTVDSQPPVLQSMSISPVGGITQAFAGFFKLGDKIAVVANLTEDNDVIAVADFSRFVSGASNAAGSCERTQANEHLCTWLTDTINRQASDNIVFNFSDNAGNTLVVTKSLRTYGLENATAPDFWSSTVACSPSAIDRSIGPLINQRIYCQVALTPKDSTKPVSTVFIGAAACSDANSIVESVDTFNTEAESTSPIIKITLKKDEFRIDNASLSCSLSIFSKVGSGTITKYPEVETANMQMKFINLPLGELSDEVKRKIKDAKEDAAGIWDIIGVLNKIVFYAKKICQLYGTLYNIVALLYTVAYAVRLTSDACHSTIFGIPFGVCAVLYNTGVESCGTQQGARETVQHGWTIANKFCAFVNCKITTLWGPTVQNFINNQLPGAQYIGPKTTTTDEGFGFKSVNPANNGVYQQPGRLQFGLPLSSYMDPQNNLLAATLFACLPGIIYGLDKYRQIKCLYADCLQNAVGKEGLPVTACEDQKAFATCKYVTGEIFAFISYTAIFDHFMGLIKNTLSNPFALLGAGISLLCWATCPAPPPTSTGLYVICEGTKLLTTMGSVIGDIKNIIDEGFTIRQDYCSRLEEEEKPQSEESSTERTRENG